MKTIINESSVELCATLAAKVQEINELLIAGGDYAAISAAIVEAKELVNNTNTKITEEEFTKLRGTEDPMRAAILKLTIPRKNVREVQDKETKAVHWEIVDGKRIIDLVSFQSFCGNIKIANEVGWQWRAELVARLVAARVTKDIGGNYAELLENYKLSKKAVEAQTREATPTSNNQLTKLLQDFVDMILYDDNGAGLNSLKITGHDVAFFLATACKLGKEPKTVTMPQGKTIINLATMMINRALVQDSYDSLYKRNEEMKYDSLYKRNEEMKKAEAQAA